MIYHHLYLFLLLQRSKSQKNEGMLRSTVREVSPAKSDRSMTPDKERSRSRDEDKDWQKRDYSDYDQKNNSSSPEKSPLPARGQSPDSKYSGGGRNTSPPPKAYRDPRSDKFRQYPPPAAEKNHTPEATERRSVSAAKREQQQDGDDYGGRGGGFQESYRLVLVWHGS